MTITKLGKFYYASATDTRTGIVYLGYGVIPTIARLCCYDAMRGELAHGKH